MRKKTQDPVLPGESIPVLSDTLQMGITATLTGGTWEATIQMGDRVPSGEIVFDESWSVPECLHQKVSQNEGSQAENHTPGHIRQGEDPAAVLGQEDTFHTESRECGHGSEKSDEEKSSCYGSEKFPLLGQVNETPHQKTAKNIRDQGSKREGIGGVPLEPCRDSIPGNGTEETSKANCE